MHIISLLKRVYPKYTEVEGTLIYITRGITSILKSYITERGTIRSYPTHIAYKIHTSLSSPLRNLRCHSAWWWPFPGGDYGIYSATHRSEKWQRT